MNAERPLPKQADASALAHDVEYFANELIRRLENLERLEKGPQRSQWQQASAVARRVRGMARREIARRKRIAKAQGLAIR